MSLPRSPYLTRYLAGEYAAVWRELVAAGSAVRHDPLRADALAVARATMERVKQNLVVLHGRLAELGFAFAAPEQALVFARADASERLDALEAELGSLSISGRVWFETFESVQLEQAEPQCLGELGPSGLQGLASHPALVIRPFEYGREQLQLYERQRESEPQLYESDPSYPPMLLVGSVLSNCATAGFELGVHHMDDLEFGADGRADASFVEFLRVCIRHGGFPFWHFMLSSGFPTPDWIPTPDLDRITPYLVADLLEF
jgi:hypothetical protein